MNVNLMKELTKFEKAEPSHSAEAEQEAHNSDPRHRFNLLSRQNEAVKRSMARELERLGLPQRAAERILHLQSKPNPSKRSQEST